MTPSNAPVTGAELRVWREAHGYSLRSLAEKLGVASSSTISAWEGGQPIPEVTQKVLRWLMRGEVPFASECDGAGLGERVTDALGQVEMTVTAFEECLRLARAAGFGSVTAWIADLVRQELHPVAERSDLALVAGSVADYVTGSTAVREPLKEAAQAFLAGDAGAAGEAGGTGAGRRGSGKPGRER